VPDTPGLVSKYLIPIKGNGAVSSIELLIAIVLIVDV
jgi:hypothetical protein